MLSDHEWRTLREVERQLLAEDPRFAQTFDARAQQLHRERHGLSTTITITIAVLLGGLTWMAGSTGGALAFVTVTGLIWLAWRYSGGTRGRAAGDPGPDRNDH